MRGSDVMSWNGQCPGVRDPLKLYAVNDLLAGPLCERKRGRIDGEFPSPSTSAADVHSMVVMPDPMTMMVMVIVSERRHCRA